MYEERSSLDKEYTCETLNVSMNQEIIIIIRDVMIVSWFVIKSRIKYLSYDMIWCNTFPYYLQIVFNKYLRIESYISNWMTDIFAMTFNFN